MVGPIGDEYGEQAKHSLEMVSKAFPGRIWNAAGKYIMGNDKEQLCMAADFFFCPSRFEPCGLADIEFGWLGAVMIGHNTGELHAMFALRRGSWCMLPIVVVQQHAIRPFAGGLGKMPGFYYTADLDCVEEQTIR